MRYPSCLLLVLLLDLVSARQSVAQPPAPPMEPPPRKLIEARPVLSAAPTVDGRLDDAVWRTTTFSTDFLQKEPVQGGAPSERTEVAFFYDRDALYVGARMSCSNLDELRALITRRDNSGAAERFIVTLDTYRDRRTSYSFSVTAAGVRTDYYHAYDDEFSREYSFDPVWEARVAVDTSGWTAEMRIPFSQLRFNDMAEQVWGLNMNRYIPHRNEDIYWIPIDKNLKGWASQFGELGGIRDIRPRLRLEVLPYAAVGATIADDHDPNDPFASAASVRARAGLDAKVGLGPNLTLDGTINPDFGQVEADPAQVNLSAFETYFDERRPFFIEGSQLLQGDKAFFYSRRIGGAPHLYAGGDYVDQPQSATILGAAKITGRLSSGLSVGVLTALTEREFARTYDAASQQYSDVEVEPLTAFGIARVAQEYGDEGSQAGATLTYVRRELEAGSTLEAKLARNAIAGGADWVLRFGDGDYELSGQVGGSVITGDSLAIAAVQRSSAHYFQRPDIEHVKYDPSRTSLAGYTFGVSLKQRQGGNWRWSIGAGGESPGFEINDAGRLNSADDLEFVGNVRYIETKPGPLFHNYSASLDVSAPLTYGGTSSGTVFTTSFGAQFKNFWGGSIFVNYGTPGIVDDYTRGGPLMGVSWNVDAGFSMYSNYGDRTRVNGGISTGITGVGNWYSNVWAWVATNFGDRFEFSVSPNFSRSQDTRQYVGTFADGRAATFDRRYVFATVERTTLSAALRLSCALTPDLSLEAYAEPFAASGSYFDFGELLAPRSQDLLLYGADGTSIARNGDGGYLVADGAKTFELSAPDFNYASFRSNLVLRWEWRPGSTLYLVWQQDRSTYEPNGRAARPGDLLDVIGARGNNFITLKASYWLPVD